MPWVSIGPDEWIQKQRKAREQYTWDDCAKDLALLTSLTINQAATVVYEVRKSGIDPYDALPHLKHITSDIPTRAGALGKLMQMAYEQAGHDAS